MNDIEIKRERVRRSLTHKVNYTYRPKNEVWWWECETCGDEGGPFNTIEDAIETDFLHERNPA